MSFRDVLAALSLARYAFAFAADAGCCCLEDFLLLTLTRYVINFLLVYLASLAVIGGAKSWDEVKKTVKGGFFPVIRVCFRSLCCIWLLLIRRRCRFHHTGHVGQLSAVSFICSEVPLA